MKEKILSTKVSIIFSFAILMSVSSNMNWGKEHWKGILKADAKGYYAYLPAIFIYKDLNFSFFDKIEKEKYHSKNLYYDYRSHSNGKMINKYYCGTAIAELPFFLTAHSISALFGFERDGYSKLYPIFINIAAIFHLCIGLFFLYKILDLYKINEKEKSFTILTALFGTNLFYYTIGEPGMSHVYSFAFISMFLYVSKIYFISFNKKYLLSLGIILAMIVLIRPINGIVICTFPFAAGNFKNFKQGILTAFQNPRLLLIVSLLFLSIVSIQLLIYKISTGHFMVYSYGDEKFNFFDPHFIDILFSYKKGLFLYTPVYLIALTGSYFLWKKNKFEFYTLTGFLILITYVFSSWWMWFYGGSFSSRVYVEYIPLFMICLALTFKHINHKTLKNIFLSLIIILIILCQIQTYQYHYNEIHWSDMTKEKYWEVFLRIDHLIQ